MKRIIYMYLIISTISQASLVSHKWYLKRVNSGKFKIESQTGYGRDTSDRYVKNFYKTGYIIQVELFRDRTIRVTIKHDDTKEKWVRSITAHNEKKVRKYDRFKYIYGDSTFKESYAVFYFSENFTYIDLLDERLDLLIEIGSSRDIEFIELKTKII